MTEGTVFGSADSGEIEEFIAAFNNYEVQAGLFDLHDSMGCPWWDLVRYRVQFALCVERGIYGYQSVPPLRRSDRARNLFRQGRRLLRDIGKISVLGNRNVGSILVSTRHSAHLTEVLCSEESRGRVALVVNHSGEVPAPHLAIAKRSVDFYVRVAAYGERLPSEVASEACQLAERLRDRFESETDLFDLIARKYREHLAARRAWSFVLDRARALDRVIYINDDTLKTLVFLARRRRIATEELQHGYMGRSHVAFSYPRLANLPETLPDKVIISRDTGDIVYPVEQVVMAKTVTVSANGGRRDIDVLIGASPTLWKETVGIVSALVKQGLSLAVKLHPAQTADRSGLRQQFSVDEIAIHEGHEDFCTLARRARIYVPANPTSTTTFEAVENGARLIVVDFGGVRKTTINDGMTSARVSSLQDLPDAVFSQLTHGASATGLHKEGCDEF
ncbi:MAG: hypothetical protein ACMVY4_02500 [Minwuia sp.]|uniref:hypothetical protein n=1 Tax=Minwuia sp. TaxID=2493630 RepID=UPI003A83F9DB